MVGLVRYLPFLIAGLFIISCSDEERCLQNDSEYVFDLVTEDIRIDQIEEESFGRSKPVDFILRNLDENWFEENFLNEFRERLFERIKIIDDQTLDTYTEISLEPVSRPYAIDSNFVSIAFGSLDRDFEISSDCSYIEHCFRAVVISNRLEFTDAEIRGNTFNCINSPSYLFPDDFRFLDGRKYFGVLTVSYKYILQ